MNIAKTNNRLSKTLGAFPKILGLSILAMLLLSACGSTAAASSPLPTEVAPLLPTRTPLPTIAPTRTPAPEPTLTPIPTVALLSDGWQEVRSGVQIRAMGRDQTDRSGSILVVRIDPAEVDFHVRYQPDDPQHVYDWYDNSRALIVINSSFFDQANHAVGQIVTDGVGDGQVHDRMEGAFYLTAAGAAVWPLEGWRRPAGLQVIESVESFPMYLLPGGLINPNLTDDPRAARRTVVAVDRSGDVLFIVTASSAFTLHGMAVWLANSDLDLDTALNFDGGSSSGLAVWTPTGVWGLNSLNKVPAVITVDVKVSGLMGDEVGGEGP
jgi:hypothetical protein